MLTLRTKLTLAAAVLATGAAAVVLVPLLVDRLEADAIEVIATYPATAPSPLAATAQGVGDGRAATPPPVLPTADSHDHDHDHAHDHEQAHDEAQEHSHPAADPDIVAGSGPGTSLEQLAVDRLLADATGTGRRLWPDLTHTPCCTVTTITIDGVTTLPADHDDTTVVVVAWTADDTARTTTSSWTRTGNTWSPTP